MVRNIEKMNGLLVKVLLSIALVFPFGLSAILLARRVLLKEMPGSMLPLLLVILLFSLLILMVRKAEKILAKIKYEENKKIWNILAIASLATLTILWRVILINKFQTPQVTEFAIAFDMAKRWVSSPYFSPEHLFAPRWGLYTLVLTKAMFVSPTLFMAKMTSVLAAAISVVFIYLTILKTTGKYLLALTGGLILSLWPSFAGYANFLTPEHLFVMLFSIAIYSLVLANSHDKDNLKKYFLYVLAYGVLIALANSFKDLTVITLPASFTVFAYFVFKDNGETKKKVMNLVIIAAILITTAFIIGKARNLIVSHYAMGPVNEISTGYFIATGLNIETSGRYNTNIGEGPVQKMRDELASGELSEETYQKTNQEFMNIAKDEVKKNYKQFPMLFIKKFYTIWSNEDEINNLNYDSYTLTNTKPDNMSLTQFREMLKTFNYYSNSFFLLTMILVTIGIAAVLWGRIELTPDLYLSVLLCSGFAAILLIIEILTRYRSILYPAIAILAAYGVSGAADYLKKRSLKTKH